MLHETESHVHEVNALLPQWLTFSWPDQRAMISESASSHMVLTEILTSGTGQRWRNLLIPLRRENAANIPQWPGTSCFPACMQFSIAKPMTRECRSPPFLLDGGLRKLSFNRGKHSLCARIQRPLDDLRRRLRCNSCDRPS